MKIPDTAVVGDRRSVFASRCTVIANGGTSPVVHFETSHWWIVVLRQAEGDRSQQTLRRASGWYVLEAMRVIVVT